MSTDKAKAKGGKFAFAFALSVAFAAAIRCSTEVMYFSKKNDSGLTGMFARSLSSSAMKKRWQLSAWSFISLQNCVAAAEAGTERGTSTKCSFPSIETATVCF